MATCNNNFFQKWSVEYVDEPQYSGEIEISQFAGGIAITGKIARDGRIHGSYTGFDISCPITDQMTFKYRLATGDTGVMELNYVNVSITGDPFIRGSYDDTGNGDAGDILLRPI